MQGGLALFNLMTKTLMTWTYLGCDIQDKHAPSGQENANDFTMWKLAVMPPVTGERSRSWSIVEDRGDLSLVFLLKFSFGFERKILDSLFIIPAVT